jgi:hypothetical protein
MDLFVKFVFFRFFFVFPTEKITTIIMSPNAPANLSFVLQKKDVITYVSGNNRKRKNMYSCHHH